MKSKLWDNVQNCEVKIEIADLPEWIKEGIETTIAKNILECLDPVKAKGNCLRMSDQLMYNLYEVGKESISPFINCKILYSIKPRPHFWLFIDGWHIDLTARQFNPNESCPKIWKDGEMHLKDIYSVEKGKYPVLFYLTPFKKNLDPVNRISNLVRSLKKHIRVPKVLFAIQEKL